MPEEKQHNVGGTCQNDHHPIDRFSSLIQCIYSTIIFILDKQELILWEEMVEIDWDILEDELDRETLNEPDGETVDKTRSGTHLTWQK